MTVPPLSKPQLGIPWTTTTGNLTPYAANWLLGIFNRSGSDSGDVGGDLTGTYPNPSVIKINGVRLGDTTAATGNILVANGTEWVRNPVSGDATLSSSGVITVTKTNGAAFASSATTDTTNAANISSGTLAVSRGGTAQNTYTNGQLLIGNTTGNTLAKTTLTPGTNIAITNGAGSITIGTTGLAASATTDTTNAGNITSGTLAVARGGTGQTTINGIKGALRNVSFVTHLSSSQSNVTGDGTQQILICDTADDNTGSGYNTSTGIFTAPTTGLYFIFATVNYEGLTSSDTSGFVEILKNAADEFLWSGNPGAIHASGSLIVSGSRLFSLTANDTIKINVRAAGSTKTVSIGTASRFGGFFLG